MRVSLIAATLSLVALLVGVSTSKAGNCGYNKQAVVVQQVVQTQTFVPVQTFVAPVAAVVVPQVHSQVAIVPLAVAQKQIVVEKQIIVEQKQFVQKQRGGFYGGGRQGFRQNQSGGNRDRFGRLLSLAATGAGAFGGASVGGPVGAVFGGIAGRAVGEALEGR